MATSNEKRFVRILNQSGWTTNQYIWVDRVTRVQYLVIAYSQGCGVTPLIDAEGKPLLYNGPLDEE